MNKHLVNMAAIAKTCGVSCMTVSRALRRNSCVAETTRGRILAAAAKIRYQPVGRMGRPRMQSGNIRIKTRIIMGIKPEGANLYHAYLLGEIEKTLAQNRSDCILRTCDGNYRNFVWLCDTLRSEQNVPTLIVGCFTIEQLGTLLELSPGALLVDYTENPGLTRQYNCIGFDNVEAGRIATRHLVEIGRRRILLVTGHRDHFFSEEIRAGYLDVLRMNGIEADEALIVASDFTAAGAYQCVLKVMQRAVKFDAVFTNDEMAVGVMRALSEKRMKMPGQVAIAGCDDLPYGRFMRPSLTTIVLDYTELGRLAVEHALSKKFRGSSAMRMRLAPKLAARESTLGFGKINKGNYSCCDKKTHNET